MKKYIPNRKVKEIIVIGTLVGCICLLSVNDFPADYVLRRRHRETIRAFDPDEVSLPAGLHRLGRRLYTPEINLDIQEPIAEMIYEQFTSFDALSCDAMTRLGHSGDGGWDFCPVGPFVPNNKTCLVYSFGINNDWSFDDTISGRYGCHVVAFDPSLNMGQHSRSDLVTFYPWGLGGKNETSDAGWPMKTLGTIIKELGHEKRTIDYLKADIEYSEWAVLATVLKENILPRVKHLGFEIHTLELLHGQTTSVHFSHYLTILRSIEELGFRKFSTHRNHDGFYTSQISGIKLPCCMELVYINTNFLQSGYETFSTR